MNRRRSMMFRMKTSPGGEEVSGGYVIDLNNQWQLSDRIPNPDSSLYEGVYESFSNYNVNNGAAIMTITINNLDTFTLYIRSYAETYYDYVMVSQLDKTIDGNTSYLYNEVVKAHTRTTQNSGTDFYSYTPVTYENIGGGEHTITIVYRKDESGNSYDDRGYILIGKDCEIYNPGSEDPDIPIGPEVMNPDNYMTIEALEDGLSAMLSANTLEYCIDASDEWIELPAGTYTQSINTGHTLHFRGNNITPIANTGIGTFTITKSCNLKGNCNSLLFGDNAANIYSIAEYAYAYYRLFYNCTAIKNVSNEFLPAMALGNYCYAYMFYGCTALETSSELPAMSLASNCYYYMFYGCTSLTKGSNLPAETLQSYCYYCMFYKCSSMTTAPLINARTLAGYCCYYMFYNCTALETAPTLWATTLTNYCYYNMFSGCSNMLYITMLAIDISASGCMSNWVKKVEKQGGVFTKNVNATWNVLGDNGVPRKWTIQYYNPETGEITT